MSEIKASHAYSSGQILEITQGDITRECLDAIVNAANSYLQHGGGVARAIVRQGGSQIQEESDAWVRTHGRVTHEKPAYTSGGKLGCRYVIHAVGPIWGEGDEDRKLSATVRSSLQVADELKLASIALPAISTGIFGFPKERAAAIILKSIVDYFLEFPQSGLKMVRIVLFDSGSVDIFMHELNRLGKT